MKKYNERMKELRIDNDLLQKQVADILNIQLTVYRRYETGERFIPIDKLIQLANHYNVTTDYLLGISDDLTPPQKSKFVRPENTTTDRGLFLER